MLPANLQPIGATLVIDRRHDPVLARVIKEAQRDLDMTTVDGKPPYGIHKLHSLQLFVEERLHWANAQAAAGDDISSGHYNRFMEEHKGQNISLGTLIELGLLSCREKAALLQVLAGDLAPETNPAMERVLLGEDKLNHVCNTAQPPGEKKLVLDSKLLDYADKVKDRYHFIADDTFATRIGIDSAKTYEHLTPGSKIGDLTVKRISSDGKYITVTSALSQSATDHYLALVNGMPRGHQFKIGDHVNYRLRGGDLEPGWQIHFARRIAQDGQRRQDKIIYELYKPDGLEKTLPIDQLPRYCQELANQNNSKSNSKPNAKPEIKPEIPRVPPRVMRAGGTDTVIDNALRNLNTASLGQKLDGADRENISHLADVLKDRNIAEPARRFVAENCNLLREAGKAASNQQFKTYIDTIITLKNEGLLPQQAGQDFSSIIYNKALVKSEECSTLLRAYAEATSRLPNIEKSLNDIGLNGAQVRQYLNDELASVHKASQATQQTFIITQLHAQTRVNLEFILALRKLNEINTLVAPIPHTGDADSLTVFKYQLYSHVQALHGAVDTRLEQEATAAKARNDQKQREARHALDFQVITQAGDQRISGEIQGTVKAEREAVDFEIENIDKQLRNLGWERTKQTRFIELLKKDMAACSDTELIHHGKMSQVIKAMSDGKDSADLNSRLDSLNKILELKHNAQHAKAMAEVGIDTKALLNPHVSVSQLKDYARALDLYANKPIKADLISQTTLTKIHHSIAHCLKDVPVQMGKKKYATHSSDNAIEKAIRAVEDTYTVLDKLPQLQNKADKKQEYTNAIATLMRINLNHHDLTVDLLKASQAEKANYLKLYTNIVLESMEPQQTKLEKGGFQYEKQIIPLIRGALRSHKLAGGDWVFVPSCHGSAADAIGIDGMLINLKEGKFVPLDFAMNTDTLAYKQSQNKDLWALNIPIASLPDSATVIANLDDFLRGIRRSGTKTTRVTRPPEFELDNFSATPGTVQESNNLLPFPSFQKILNTADHAPDSQNDGCKY